jgi:hypothetical protein
MSGASAPSQYATAAERGASNGVIASGRGHSPAVMAAQSE